MSDLVRAAIDHYHELLPRHVGATRALLGSEDTVSLRPHFIGHDELARLMTVTELLNRGVVTAADRLAKDPALRRKLGFPDYLDRLIELDREWGVPSAIARFDGIVDASGELRIIEYNSIPGFRDVLDVAFERSELAAEFRERFAFRPTSLTNRALEELSVRDGAHTRPPVIAVPVTTLPAPRDKYIRMDWVTAGEARGWRVIDATIDQLRHIDGRLYVEQDERIAVDVLMPEWNDLTAWVGAGNVVIDAIRERSARVLYGVSRGLLCGYKHTLELLSNPEYAGMFEPEVAAALARHVPWTRVVRHDKTTSADGQVVDLLRFIADNRERLVIKPSGGHRGAGVLLGSECTDADWRQALKRSLTQKCIVQERVSGATETFPCVSGDGFVMEPLMPSMETFVWGGSKAGDALARTSTNGNHTLGRGGHWAALWIIEGRR